MLTITIPGIEVYDEIKEEFVTIRSQCLRLEHSLVSISKWEARWHKAFLTDVAKTQVETIDYVRCMTITQNVPDDVYRILTPDNIDEINKYIEEPMTATIINTNSPDKKGQKKETITSELIYYWMITLNIPFECQKWHINRLLTMVSVCNIKNNPPKKLGRGELLRRNKELNDKRKEKLNTKG